MHRFRLLALLFLTALALPASAQPTKWRVDLSHSSILTSVRHAASPFFGLFKEFSGDVTWDAKDAANCAVSMSVDPKSYDSENQDRDDYLKSKDFFDAAAHGAWTYTSTAIRLEGDGYIAQGLLTARGKTLEIPVKFNFLGTHDAGKYGGLMAGISATFRIRRSDFGLGGDLNGLLSDEVDVQVHLALSLA